MVCYKKSSLSTYSIVDQEVAVGDYVRFDINRVDTGSSIQHVAGTNAITLAGAGLYSGDFSADFTIDATGPVTFQLFRNGVAVTGAEATTQATLATPIHISFPILELVRPSCVAIDNTAVLQVQVSAAGTINATTINLVKEA